jgi:hypothetical protein
MKNVHLILSGNNTSKLDESIRFSRKMYSIDRLIVVIPEHQTSIFKDKIRDIKQKWKDVDLKEVSLDGIELCALDLCDIIYEILLGDNKDKDVIINISHSDPTFAIAGFFCACILKIKIISEINGEPEDISRVPYEELIPIRYAILSKIPEIGIGNQELLMNAVNDAFKDGSYPEIGLKHLSPTNLSHHLKYLDNEEFIIRVTSGRKKEIVITNLGRLMKISYEILKLKKQKK